MALEVAFALAGVAALAVGSVVLAWRRTELVWRQVHWPQALAPEVCLALLRQVAADRRLGVVALEAEGSGGVVVYRIGAEAEAIGRLETLVQLLVPEAALTAAPARPSVSWVSRLRLNSSQRALRSDEPEVVTRGLLAGLAQAGEGEVVVWQWLLGPRRRPQPVASRTASSEVEPAWKLLLGGSRRLDPEPRKALAVKRSEHGFAALARIGVGAASRQRQRQLLAAVTAALGASESPGMQVRLLGEPRGRLFDAARPLLWPLRMNVGELIGLTAWPLGEESLPGVSRDGARWLRADPLILSGGRVIAQSTAPGEARLLGLGINDALQHMHALGPTGTGKSTLLLNLALQDIGAGRGVVVIDPKGDLVDDLLDRLPEERIGDAVVLDPTDTAAPVGLNPLSVAQRNSELVADQVLAVFHSLYEDSWGPRTADILHASLLSLAGRPEATLCALPVLLTNPAVRRRLLAGIDDPIALGPFWAWYEGLRESERQQVIAPIMNKLRAFLLRRRVRAVLGQSQPLFDVGQVFTERKILLVSLAKGLLGPEASALLGSLVVAQLWNASLERVALSPEQRSPTVLYIDEWHDFVRLPTDLGDALAQARGLGVALVLANQHLTQLPDEMRSAVLANARSRVCFQLPAEDARIVVRSAGGELTPEDFQRLPRYEVYVQLVAQGEVRGFASGRTLPPPSALGTTDGVRAVSRARYGRSTADVDAEIARLINTPDPEGPIGVRSRSHR